MAVSWGPDAAAPGTREFAERQWETVADRLGYPQWVREDREKFSRAHPDFDCWYRGVTTDGKPWAARRRGAPPLAPEYTAENLGQLAEMAAAAEETHPYRSRQSGWWER